MKEMLIVFLQAVSATGAWVSGLIFLRFWHDSRDSLFAYFAAAFWLLGVSWALFTPVGSAEESRPDAYATRVTAFVLIAVGVLHNNRHA